MDMFFKILTSPSNSETNASNPIIDLTQSFDFSTVNWPRGTIELNDSIPDSPPRCGRRGNGQGNSHRTEPQGGSGSRRRRYSRNEQDNRNSPEPLDDSNVVIINDSPAAPLTRPRRTTLNKNRKSPKTKNNNNNQQLQESKADFRDRSPVFLGHCPICYEPYGKNPLVSTKCGHVFCLKCLQQAIKTSKRCPNCRTTLRGNKCYHPLYFQ